MENITETIDNGETEVQIATVGTVVGSDVDGNPVEQNFTEESLQKIAENTTDEVLVDAEHQSEKGGTTEAKGWLSKLNFIPGKGLMGCIRWTDIGRKLVENRVFRWLSPSWLIDKVTKEPVAMTSVALTNKPSQMGRIDPIINQEPLKETLTMDMTKEELINLIKETVVNYCSEKKDAEVKNEVVEEQPKAEEPKAEDTKEIQETADAPKQEVVSEEPKVEEPKETKPTAIVIEETNVEQKKEVIKEEALNSAPTIGSDVNVEPEWKKLHGREFLEWYKKNYRNYR